MSKTKLLKSKRLTLIAATFEHIRVEPEAPVTAAGTGREGALRFELQRPKVP